MPFQLVTSTTTFVRQPETRKLTQMRNSSNFIMFNIIEVFIYISQDKEIVMISWNSVEVSRQCCSCSLSSTLLPRSPSSLVVSVSISILQVLGLNPSWIPMELFITPSEQHQWNLVLLVQRFGVRKFSLTLPAFAHLPNGENWWGHCWCYTLWSYFACCSYRPGYEANNSHGGLSNTVWWLIQSRASVYWLCANETSLERHPCCTDIFYMDLF